MVESLPVREFFAGMRRHLEAQGTGGANRVTRALILAELPAIDVGEVADKGSIHQRVVLAHRAAEVERLYGDSGGVLLAAIGGEGWAEGEYTQQRTIELSATRMPTPFRIRDIDHVVLRVRDLERMIDFYSRVLGCSVEWRRPDLGLVHLRAGGAMIDMVPVAGPLGSKGGAAPGAAGRNMDHVCLRVEPFDQDAIVRHLQSHQVRVGEIRPRFGAQGEGMSIYAYDPEDNLVELKGAIS